MTRATILAVIIIVLLLPATALAISNVELVRHGDAMTYLPANNPYQAAVEFTPSQEAAFFEVHYITPEGETTSGGFEGASSCTRCRSNSIEFTRSEEVTVRIEEYTSADQLIKREEHTFELSIDEQAPEIQRLRIGDCTNSCAYNDASEVTVEIQDAGGSGVSEETVTIRANQQLLETTCETTDTYTCTASLQGLSEELTIRVQAADRAGNLAEPRTLQARYDNIPPKITRTPQFINLYGVDEQPTTTQIPASQQAVIELYVREQERPDVLLETNFTEERGACTRDTQRDNDYRCTINFRAPSEPGSYEANITATDPAGNPTIHEFEITIIQADTQIEPNFWDVQAHPMSLIDHETWAVNSVRLPLDLSLKARSEIGAQPMQINIHDCTLKGATSERQATTIESAPRAERNTSATLRLERQGENALSRDSKLLSNPELSCDVTIYTRAGNTVFTTPETKTFTIQPQFTTSLPPASDAIDRRIEQKQQEAERGNQMYSGLRTSYQVLRTLCRSGRPLDVAAQTLATSGAPLTASPEPATRGAGESMVQSGRQLGNTADSLHESIEPLCAMMTCDIVDRENYMGAFGLSEGGFAEKLRGPLDTIASLGGAEDSAELLDPHKSIVVAASTRCLPAIIHNIDRLQNIRCAKQECLQQVPDGRTTIDACTFSEREMKCRYVTGQVYYALPVANMVDNIQQTLATAFSNPLSLIGLASVATCEISGGAVGAACTVARQGEKIGEITGFINQIEEMYTSIQQYTEDPGSYCSQVQSSVERTNRYPFRGGNRCQGGFSTYQAESSGKTFVTVGEQTCLVRENTLDTSAPGSGTEQAASILAGAKIDCTEVSSAERQEAADAYNTCRRNYLDEFKSLESGQELMDLIRQSDKLNQEYGERQGKLEDHNTALGATDQEFSSRYSSQANHELVYEVDGIVVVCTGAATDPVHCEFPDRGMPLTLPEAEELLAMSDEEINELDPAVRTYLNDYQEEALQIRQEYQRLQQDKDATEEEIAELEEQLSDLESERKSKTREVKNEAYRESLDGITGSIKGVVSNMLVWGTVGDMGDRMFGIGLADTGVGQAMGGVAESIEGTRDIAVDAVCSVAGNTPPPQAVSAFTGGGQPVAHLTAVSSASQNPDGITEYNYRVDVSISAIQDETATLVLRSGASRTTLEEFELSQATARFGRQAIATQTSANYNQACLVFSNSLEDMFGNVVTTSGVTGNQLCTQIRRN